MNDTLFTTPYAGFKANKGHALLLEESQPVPVALGALDIVTGQSTSCFRPSYDLKAVRFVFSPGHCLTKHDTIYIALPDQPPPIALAPQNDGKF
jgi:hypothetical protein